MLQAIITLSFFVGLYSLLTRYIKNKIKKAKTASEAISLRAKVKWIRLIVFSLFIVFAFVLSFFINLSDKTSVSTTSSYVNWILNSIAIIVTSFTTIELGNFGLPLSVSTISTVRKPPVLYLRAFEKDSYRYSKQEYPQKGIFKEKILFDILRNKKLKMYCVGMSKEVESPQGAERIYIDDVSWKEDVLTLMKSSRIILILISDRSSCIWEIEQSLSMLNKTIFIVDNLDKYNQVREFFKEKIDFPEIKPSKNTDISFFYFEKETVIIKGFSGKSKDSYIELADTIYFSAPPTPSKWRIHSSIRIIERYSPQSYMDSIISFLFYGKFKQK